MIYEGSAVCSDVISMRDEFNIPKRACCKDFTPDVIGYDRLLVIHRILLFVNVVIDVPSIDSDVSVSIIEVDIQHYDDDVRLFDIGATSILVISVVNVLIVFNDLYR